MNKPWPSQRPGHDLAKVMAMAMAMAMAKPSLSELWGGYGDTIPDVFIVASGYGENLWDVSTVASFMNVPWPWSWLLQWPWPWPSYGLPSLEKEDHRMA